MNDARANAMLSQTVCGEASERRSIKDESVVFTPSSIAHARHFKKIAVVSLASA
jgi:hypothetical protein